MQHDSGQERTERATPKRLTEAREKGQVARSRELSTALVLLAGGGGLLILGGHFMGRLQALMKDGLHIERAQAFDEMRMVETLAQVALDAVGVLAPFFVLVILAAMLAPVALSGWVFSAKSLAFNWSKLNPIEGLGRIFGRRGIAELLKALAKFVLVAVGAVTILWHLSHSFLGLGYEPLTQGLTHTGRLLGWSFLALSALTLLIAAVDVPFQLWDHAQQLKMTKQEVKDEMKETEGKPEVKGHIRRMQQEMAQRRMMTEVPKADVIITNPTHYAVALRYDQDGMRAPVLVAKGMDLVAENIRRIGAESRVPLMSAPPLARALYHNTPLNQEIPAGLYLAVAKVLAYVYQLRHGVNPGTQAPQPPSADELPVPPELQRD